MFIRPKAIPLAAQVETILTLPNELSKQQGTLTMAVQMHATQCYISPDFSNAFCHILRPERSSPSNAYQGYGRKSSLSAQKSKE